MKSLYAMPQVIKLRITYSNEIINQSVRNHLLTLLKWCAPETLPWSKGD